MAHYIVVVLDHAKHESLLCFLCIPGFNIYGTFDNNDLIELNNIKEEEEDLILYKTYTYRYMQSTEAQMHVDKQRVSSVYKCGSEVISLFCFILFFVPCILLRGSSKLNVL